MVSREFEKSVGKSWLAAGVKLQEKNTHKAACDLVRSHPDLQALKTELNSSQRER